VTARPIPGTHAQKVILVALELLHEPPATTDTLVDGLAVALDAGEPRDELDEPLLLHPPSSEMATAPATAVVKRASLKGTRGRCRNRVLDDIVAGLLCSVLPCVRLPLC
jgi:hypothetical protein